MTWRRLALIALVATVLLAVGSVYAVIRRPKGVDLQVALHHPHYLYLPAYGVAAMYALLVVSVLATALVPLARLRVRPGLAWWRRTLAAGACGAVVAVGLGVSALQNAPHRTYCENGACTLVRDVPAAHRYAGAAAAAALGIAGITLVALPILTGMERRRTAAR